LKSRLDAIGGPQAVGDLPLLGLQQIIDRLPVAVLVLDLSDRRGCFGNLAAATLMDSPWPFGEAPFELGLADVVGARVAAEIEPRLVALESGAIPGYQGDRRFSDGQGQTIEAHHSLTRVDLCDASPVAVAMITVKRGGDRPGEPPSRDRQTTPVLATLDHDWRFDAVSPDAETALGLTPAALVGNSLLAEVHPNDVAEALAALSRSLEEGPTTTTTRLRVGDGWRTVGLVVGPLCRHQPARSALWIRPQRFTGPEVDDEERLDVLERHIRRIAREVEATGIGVFLAAHEPAVPVDDLTSQQAEVIARLLRGESIATMAAGLHLSRSTVRNHLSAVYRKFGVHSQAELVAHLTGRQPPPTQGEDATGV
jgi:DNA-binding CsgD family transcriptional regulator